MVDVIGGWMFADGWMFAGGWMSRLVETMVAYEVC